MKQKSIDNGQIGGMISVLINSGFPFTLLSLIGIATLNYDKFLKVYMSFTSFILLAVFALLIWEYIFYVYVFPSFVIFSNRQSCTHSNPMMDKLNQIENKIEELNKKIER